LGDEVQQGNAQRLTRREEGDGAKLAKG
jgi:hypothetical protein